jgi:hypothetical protein
MESTTQGITCALQELPVCKHPEPKMQILTRMDRVPVEDHYHMTTMDESANWMKLTHLLSSFSLNLGALFVHLSLFYIS